MSEVNFYLKKDKVNKQGSCPVVIQLNFNNERLFFPTGIKVKPKFWNDTKQRMRPNGIDKGFDDQIEFNAALDGLEEKAKRIFNEALIRRIPLSKDYIKSRWFEDYSRSKNDFFKAFLNFVEVHRSVKASRTTKGYMTTINFLQRFEQDNQLKITFDNFNLDLYEKVRDYAFRENGYANNYLATIVNKLKAFLNWATDRGLNYNLAYRKFKAPEFETAIVCLYEDELFALYSHNFESKRLEQARDVYCFGCFTGLRYSDILDLKREHIQGDELQKTIIKTKQFLKIPLNKFALEILKKYEDYAYSPLPRISSQKFNEYIKEACAIVGIDTPTTVINYSGGRLLEKTVPKCELITSHTARKTFATNSLIFGMTETAVKRITGHKKDQSFQRYVNFADRFLKEQTNTAWNGRG